MHAAYLGAGRYARGTAFAAILITFTWHILNDLTAVVLRWPSYRWPVVSAGAWLVFTAIAVVAAIHLLRGVPLEPVWPHATVAIVLSGVGSLACDPQLDLISPQNWPWGAVGWLGVMLYWHRPIRALGPFLAINGIVSTGVIVAAGQSDRVSLSRIAMVIAGSIGLQLGFAAGARVLVAAADWTTEISSAQARANLTRAAADEVHLSRRQRYDALQCSAAGLLRALADGTADPLDEAIQRRCAAEAARLRRLFVETDDLPHPLVDELRACTDLAERRGVAVSFAAVGRPPALDTAARRALADAPIEVLSATRSQARLTVVAAPDRVSVSVVADANIEPARIEGVRQVDASVVVIECHRSEGRLWVEASWRGQP